MNYGHRWVEDIFIFCIGSVLLPHTQPQARSQILSFGEAKYVFTVGWQDFCLCYMFKTNFSERNKIWGVQKFYGPAQPTLLPHICLSVFLLSILIQQWSSQRVFINARPPYIYILSHMCSAANFYRRPQVVKPVESLSLPRSRCEFSPSTQLRVSLLISHATVRALLQTETRNTNYTNAGVCLQQPNNLLGCCNEVVFFVNDCDEHYVRLPHSQSKIIYTNRF